MSGQPRFRLDERRIGTKVVEGSGALANPTERASSRLAERAVVGTCRAVGDIGAASEFDAFACLSKRYYAVNSGQTLTAFGVFGR